MLLDYLKNRGVKLIEGPTRKEFPHLTVIQPVPQCLEICYKVSSTVFATAPFSEEGLERKLKEMIEKMSQYEEIIGTAGNPITIYIPKYAPPAFIKIADKIK